MLTLDPILLDDSVYEVRMPKTRQGTISGYFDDLAQLAKSVALYDGKVPGVYVTMNSCNPALLARAVNRLRTHAKVTTADPDIRRRDWLLVDVDASRPADISSTEEEHQAALAKAKEIMSWLSSLGWPDSLFADSGNGAHLRYRIDLPNDDPSRQIVKHILEVLALKFDDRQVHVDVGMHNAARITKLCGTMVMKGDHTADRPHRRSGVLYVPDAVEIVPSDLLTALGAMRPVDPNPTTYANGRGYDLRSFLQRHHLTVRYEKPWQHGATVFDLEVCPFNEEHVRSSSVMQFASGAVHFKCFHNSCADHHWQQLRQKLETHGPWSSSNVPANGAAAEPAAFTLVRAADIRPAPVRWAIQSRLPIKMLSLLCGKPDLGKSTLALDWAAQLTRGQAAGAWAGHPVDVIVSSTEDTEQEVLTPRLIAAQADLQRVGFIRLHRDGVDGSLSIPADIDVLRQAILNSGAKFVAIDPLMAHLSTTINGWNEQQIRWALTPLARLAEECAIAVLIVCHLNKDTTKEALDRIGGSGGTGNVARSILFVGADPNEPDSKTRMLAHAKCNVGDKQPTLRYRLDKVQVTAENEKIETSRVVWEGEAPGITVEDLLAKPDPVTRQDREQAVDWLAKVLPVGYDRRRKQSDLEAEAAKAGISKWVLKRAKPFLRVRSERKGFTDGGWWWWRDETSDSAPHISPSQHPSTKKSRNCAKKAKAADGSTAAPIEDSSTSSSFSSTLEGSIEESKVSQSAPFMLSADISNTYTERVTEGSSTGNNRGKGQGTDNAHVEAEEVDYRAS
jgi:hypothetical protein